MSVPCLMKLFSYLLYVREEGTKVLVHCKMGISRSASVVIAYVMKAKNWNLTKSFAFVKNKRNCIKPNENFLKQLEVYEGILNARLASEPTYPSTINPYPHIHNNHNHHNHGGNWVRPGTSIGFISRRGTGGRVQCTPEDSNKSPMSPAENNYVNHLRDHHHLHQQYQSTIRSISESCSSALSSSMTSSSLTMLNRLSCLSESITTILSDDRSVVPNGIVTKKKENFQNLTRSHSFANPLSRTTGSGSTSPRSNSNNNNNS